MIVKLFRTMMSILSQVQPEPEPASPSPSPSPSQPEPARAPSPSPEPASQPAPTPEWSFILGPLLGSRLSANATIARNPYLTRHFSRQNAVYCPFSKKERVFPDWSSLFGPFLEYFQIRNAIFVDCAERNTASVGVWVILVYFRKISG